MPNKPEYGSIGIGLLGAALTQRLLEHGHTVVGFDPLERSRRRFAAAGGLACDHAAEVVRRCQTIVLSLPDSDIVAEVLRELSSNFRAGQTVVDTTTGDPEQMIAIGKSLADVDVNYVEATVAGSSAQLREGKAVLFVGGAADVVAEVEPLLNVLANTHFHLGDVGTASRFKLVHNLVLGLHRAVLAEGLVFGEALGFDPARVLEILTRTPAASAVMETKGRRMVDRDFEPLARLAQHLKDVRLILAEADKHGAVTPLSELHENLLRRAVDLGFGESDNSAVIEAFRAR